MRQKVWEWALGHRIHWLYHIPHHPEAAILIRHWNCLLMVQVKHQPRGNNSPGEWVVILPNTLYTLKQRPLYESLEH